MTHYLKILMIATVVIALGACAHGQPVYNVSSSPITTNKAKPSLDEIGKAIARAGAALGWEMKQVAPGKISGTLKLRKHVAVVDIPYDTQSYSIKYVDSTELNYADGNIHKNYNGWIQNLEKGIRAQLMAL